MKRIVLILGLFMIVGCKDNLNQQLVIVEKIPKIIIEKVIEPGNPNAVVCHTGYYLFAEDGTYVEVDMPSYGRTKIGSEYSSSNWIR